METLKNLQALVKRLEEKSPFYQQRFKEAGIVAADIKTMADFENLPFTDKSDLRNAYPLVCRRCRTVRWCGFIPHREPPVSR